MKYKLYGTKKIPKGKAATFGYKEFETSSKKKVINFINTHAIIPCAVKDGHRLTKNVTKIYNWIRLDLDGKGEYKKVKKRLKDVEYFAKPSTSNDGKTNKHKWHIFVPIENASQSYDAYKLQYHNFLAAHKIDIQDVSLSSVVQNTNPRGEDGIKRTVHNKGNVWVAPTLKAPKRKKSKEKHSDVSKAEVKKKLKHINPNMKYAEWLKVAMSLYDWCPKKGLKLFDKWSSGGDDYDQQSVHDKWDDFESGSLSGDVTIGTLLSMDNMGHYEEREEDEFEDVTEYVEKLKKKATKKEKKALEGFDPFNTGMTVLSDHTIDDRKNQHVLFKSLLVERMHTFLYGASGSNKTTVIAWVIGEVLINFDDKICQFWSFDAAQDHETSIFNYMKTKDLHEDRYQIITGATSADFFSHYEKAIKVGSNLSDLVVVIDTFKFITENVNDKNANKKAMHFIKELLALGATVLSIGHSNKDGIKQSGTAEIEQDSDGVLRIDREVKTNGDVILSISKGGRVRFGCEGITLICKPTGSNYEYLYTSLTTMRVNDEFIDVAKDNDEKASLVEEEKKAESKKEHRAVEDKVYIREIVRIIDTLKKDKHAKPLQQTIIQLAKIEESLGKTLVNRLLRDYNDIYWVFKPYRHKGGGKPTKLYKVTARGKNI